jgi:hypothetical protein
MQLPHYGLKIEHCADIGIGGLPEHSFAMGYADND